MAEIQLSQILVFSNYTVYPTSSGSSERAGGSTKKTADDPSKQEVMSSTAPSIDLTHTARRFKFHLIEGGNSHWYWLSTLFCEKGVIKQKSHIEQS